MPELKLENSLVDSRYEVYERLSRGSYAEIFVARDREAGGMEVVIKALNTSLQGTPDAELERTLVENFQNEAIALDSVRHPHVILRWGHGTAADLRGVPFHYLVLEYMPGGDLLKLCRRRQGDALPLKDALFFFRQVCEALAYAHSKGVIHRDLKPNNFLLSEDHQTLKIADFGVAKISTDEDTEITRVGADIYAPPEHHPDEDTLFSRLTAAADIYSLAKSFYTVVCGRAPSEFKCDPIAFLPPHLKRYAWADPLLAVLKRATEDEPSQRYESVVEFWSDLAQVAAFDTEEAAEEETIVKPRLKVNPGAMPETPVQPEFEPTLASARPHKMAPGAMPVATQTEPQVVAQSAEPLPRDERDRRGSKVYIELGRQARSNPLSESLKKNQAPPETKPGAGIEQRPQNVVEKFNETLRRRIFITLLGLALLGSLISVYNFARNKGFAVGFGQPTEIEIVTDAMNVRAGPNSDSTLGVVLKGSRHRVLTQNERGWLNIEVGQWDESRYHSLDQNRGWVYGNPDYVRVVSRRWW